MTNPSSLGVLTLGGFLLGNRRVTGQIVQVGDDAGQHPEHTGSIERDVLRLGIGLGPQVHHDPLSAVQAFQPLAALAESLQLTREASLKVGCYLNPHSSGQSPPVPGRPRRPGGSSLFPVPRDQVRMIGIIATIEHVVT